MNFKPGGMATGIGSMPFLEPDNALSLIFENLPEAPHWPQLPRRGEAEGFVYQFLNPLVEMGLLVKDGGKTYFNTLDNDWADRMTEFYSTYLAAEEGDVQALERFAVPSDSAVGLYSFINRLKESGTGQARYLKGQEAGPLTIGFQLKDAEGRFSYYEDQLRDILVKTLAMHARWQTKTLSQFGLPVIFFVDEPGIGVYGKGTHITVTREMILADMNAIAGAVHAANGLPGVHSCDAIDWSLLFESDMDIVNLDVYNFASSLIPTAKELKQYLKRGGIMAWGMAPTTDDAFNETAETLLDRLYDIWAELEKRGIDRGLLKEQSLITPACGAGLLEEKLTQQIYRLTREISAKLAGTDAS
ncbi:MAG: hypothetical protein FH756_15510 [Firmicutes bacterium]|nr:hypothetical protein [Bacillota bacterium]